MWGGEMAKLRYEDETIVVEITVHEIDEQAPLSLFLDRLLHPLLLGIGYSPTLVERVLVIDEED
jgi:hypothetical protein